MNQSEIVEISEGGPLGIRGDQEQPSLFLGQDLIHTVWYYSCGTTMRYHIGKVISEKDLILDRTYQNFVQTGDLTEAPLADQFQYIISRLASGRYELKVEEITQTFGVFTHSDSFLSEHYDGIHEYDVRLIATQDRFAHEAISSYKQCISTGTRPIVVLLSGSKFEDYFIIDGHHKLFAYQELGINPRALTITRLDEQRLTEKEAKQIFNDIPIDERRKYSNFEGNFFERYNFQND